MFLYYLKTQEFSAFENSFVCWYSYRNRRKGCICLLILNIVYNGYMFINNEDLIIVYHMYYISYLIAINVYLNGILMQTMHC